MGHALFSPKWMDRLDRSTSEEYGRHESLRQLERIVQSYTRRKRTRAGEEYDDENSWEIETEKHRETQGGFRRCHDADVTTMRAIKASLRRAVPLWTAWMWGQASQSATWTARPWRRSC